LNAAKFVVSVLAASPAPAPAALPLLVSGVGAGGGVGSAALESRRERRAVAVVVDVRESDGDPYFFAVTVDGDVGEGGDGDGGTTAGLFVLSEETVVGPVDVVRLWDKLERGTRGLDVVGGTLDLPVPVNLLLALLFGGILDPLSEDGSSTLLRRE
jgi:hypothetical protein